MTQRKQSKLCIARHWSSLMVPIIRPIRSTTQTRLTSISLPYHRFGGNSPSYVGFLLVLCFVFHTFGLWWGPQHWLGVTYYHFYALWGPNHLRDNYVFCVFIVLSMFALHWLLLYFAQINYPFNLLVHLCLFRLIGTTFNDTGLKVSRTSFYECKINAISCWGIPWGQYIGSSLIITRPSEVATRSKLLNEASLLPLTSIYRKV